MILLIIPRSVDIVVSKIVAQTEVLINVTNFENVWHPTMQKASVHHSADVVSLLLKILHDRDSIALLTQLVRTVWSYQ